MITVQTKRWRRVARQINNPSSAVSAAAAAAAKEKSQRSASQSNLILWKWGALWKCLVFAAAGSKKIKEWRWSVKSRLGEWVRAFLQSNDFLPCRPRPWWIDGLTSSASTQITSKCFFPFDFAAFAIAISSGAEDALRERIGHWFALETTATFDAFRISTTTFGNRGEKATWGEGAGMMSGLAFHSSASSGNIWPTAAPLVEETKGRAKEWYRSSSALNCSGALKEKKSVVECLQAALWSYGSRGVSPLTSPVVSRIPRGKKTSVPDWGKQAAAVASNTGPSFLFFHAKLRHPNVTLFSINGQVGRGRRNLANIREQSFVYGLYWSIILRRIINTFLITPLRKESSIRQTERER